MFLWASWVYSLSRCRIVTCRNFKQLSHAQLHGWQTSKLQRNQSCFIIKRAFVTSFGCKFSLRKIKTSALGHQQNVCTLYIVCHWPATQLTRKNKKDVVQLCAVDCIEIKLSKALYILRSSKNLLAKKSLKAVHYSIFHCYLIYCVPSWGCTSQKLMKGLYPLMTNGYICTR